MEQTERNKLVLEILNEETTFAEQFVGAGMNASLRNKDMGTVANDCGRMATDITHLEAICKGLPSSNPGGTDKELANQLVWGFVAAGKVKNVKDGIRCARLLRRDRGTWSYGAESVLVRVMLALLVKVEDIAEFTFLLKNERSVDVLKLCLNKSYMEPAQPLVADKE